MKRYLLLFTVSVLMCSCKSTTETQIPAMNNALDSLSYCVGLDLGDYIVRTNNKLDLKDELDYDLLVAGIKATIEGDKTINPNARFEILRRYFNEILPELNARSSEKYIKRALKEKSNAVESPSGLVYEIVQPGNGIKPGPDDMVRFKYEGRRMNGTLYETTYDMDIVESKPMDMMIPGIREGLTYIGEGGIIKLWIKPSLAYGEEGNDYIGPNQALYYYIELENVQRTE